MEQRTVHSLDAMGEFAEELLGGLVPRDDGRATVLALSGDLGSGKTAFVKALARHLGVEEHVTSPTFVIMKTYNIQPTTNDGNGFGRLVHIDAYRMQSAAELSVLGWEGLLADPANLIALEWPELVEDVMPEDALTLAFEHVDETTRSVHSKIQIPKSKQAPNSKIQT
ncbi:MAG TPA: tRNA (adenosine(37)-N6)-threonylcarbamoyltransferase complex ATPase subunit type 1 TsaE [Candidatus Paceibacterota bacterium]|nr:tRNA (adenosine(37)-N6)-threonylcarbamoyltransferase complex ATPase subunit type 1 TsaE [Candidatus Paceibacterota bacterium]